VLDDFDGMTVIGINPVTLSGSARLLKRGLDLTLAAVALLTLLPLLPFVALAIKLDSPGPVFFVQDRRGRHGRRFRVIKLRTMVADAERQTAALRERSNHSAWLLLDEDPRITPFGQFLRRTSIDELPQLWNVLRGEMSLVGPRPERPEFLELLEDRVPHWSRRLLVKPGITGWAQVCCGYTSDAASALDKLSYDLYYIKHRSPILDFAVAAKTATIIFSGSGAK
jgi:exopolysaccharide biosynthesis polyprenyl glycosylphosphotransferase